MKRVSRWPVQRLKIAFLNIMRVASGRLNIASSLRASPFPHPRLQDGVETELLMTKGTLVYIGLGAANRSAAIWGPDASELKPERWLRKALLDGTVNSVKMPGIFSNA